MTIAQAHRHAAQTLQTLLNLDRAEARTRARLIVDHLFGMPYAHLFVGPERTLEAQHLEQFEAALEQALRGRPLPYIVGRREFYGLTFEVDERALIPRPESELLVEAALQRLQSTLSPHIADLGTGSGCIAVALAITRPDATIWATDVSPDALVLAQQNAARHGVNNRVHFLLSDGTSWAAPLAALPNPFDAILSNPPYIASSEIADLQSEVRDWEPRRALDGGQDGLNAYRDLAAQIKALLKPNSFFACELGAGQWKKVRVIFETSDWQVEAAIQDFAGIERVLLAR